MQALEQVLHREQLTLELMTLLMSPAFMIYSGLIAGFIVLCTHVLVDLLLKIAYSICSGLVGLLTPSSLPAAPDARLDARYILPTTTTSLYPITIHKVEANPITVFVGGNHEELH